MPYPLGHGGSRFPVRRTGASGLGARLENLVRSLKMPVGQQRPDRVA